MASPHICQCNQGPPLGASGNPPGLSAGRRVGSTTPSGNGQPGQSRPSPQFRVLGLGLLQDGAVGAGVFPSREEFVAGGARFGGLKMATTSFTTVSGNLFHYIATPKSFSPRRRLNEATASRCCISA